MKPLSPEVFKFALDHAADAVLITDTAVKIVYVNGAFERLTGYSAGDAAGKRPSFQASGRTSRAQYDDMWASLERMGRWEGDLVNRRHDGEEWVARASISRVLDGDGKAVAYVAIETDVTELRDLHRELKAANLEAIHMLAVACEAKDETTGNHLNRVQQYVRAIAKRLGVDGEAAEEMGYSSVMHDLGKLHVPDAVLMKPAALDEKEWLLMKRHPKDGVAILRKGDFFAVAREIAGNHHERWDGTGYPEGRKGEEIPLSARITTVADVFDALSTKRPYKEPWPEPDVLAEMRRLRGATFDPRVVDAFFELCNEGVIRSIRARFP